MITASYSNSICLNVLNTDSKMLEPKGQFASIPTLRLKCTICLDSTTNVSSEEWLKLWFVPPGIVKGDDVPDPPAPIPERLNGAIGTEPFVAKSVWLAGTAPNF